jgi:signal transduction histidine kinase/CheY-like chemotaxis protein
MQSQEARRQLMASEADKMQQPSPPPTEDVGTLFSALQQAENELAITRAALERKTQELTHALAAQKEIEAELRQQRDWRDADRRKDEFLATLAHELRNPLAPIRQAALISKAPTATDAQKRWSHDVIDRQVQHMSLLLDDLLDISRVTRGTLALRMQSTELSSVIDTAVETARPTIDSKRHVLSVDMPPEPIRFTVDPLRVAQVLSNLLTNAAKYTDPEGQIRLIARCESDDVVIRVADSGIGISAATLPRVFNMFSQVHSTTDRSEGGLGIGLALAQGLIELHGGTIEAKSEGLGCGSEFTVRLPRRAAMAPAQAVANGAPTTRATLRRRILIADDNRDSAETLAALLRMEGHEVTSVHDGPVALSVFGELKPDVALLDIGMPGLTGYEVARKMRQAAPRVPLTLIAITGWGQDIDKERAYAAGFDHHLTKPVDPQRLVELLKI